MEVGSDFEGNDVLMQCRCRRLVLEGEVWGAFVHTDTSLHFYPILNAVSADGLHFVLDKIWFAMRYKYLGRDIGVNMMIYGEE